MTEIKTSTFPDKCFVFHMDEAQIEALIRSFYTNNIFTKKDIFKEESPDWLADTFIIKGIDELNGVNGNVEISPLDELYIVDETRELVMVNKKKHEKVALIIYRESII